MDPPAFLSEDEAPSFPAAHPAFLSEDGAACFPALPCFCSFSLRMEGSEGDGITGMAPEDPVDTDSSLTVI